MLKKIILKGSRSKGYLPERKNINWNYYLNITKKGTLCVYPIGHGFLLEKYTKPYKLLILTSYSYWIKPFASSSK